MVGAVMWNIALRPRALLCLHILKINRDRNVRHPSIRERAAAGEIQNVLHMIRAHHALVVYTDIHEQFVEGNVLLRMRAG